MKCEYLTCFNMSFTTSIKIRIKIENEASNNRLFGVSGIHMKIV